jgi:hypothetical protein
MIVGRAAVTAGMAVAAMGLAAGVSQAGPALARDFALGCVATVRGGGRVVSLLS